MGDSWNPKVKLNDVQLEQKIDSYSKDPKSGIQLEFKKGAFGGRKVIIQLGMGKYAEVSLKRVKTALQKSIDNHWKNDNDDIHTLKRTLNQINASALKVKSRRATIKENLQSFKDDLPSLGSAIREAAKTLRDKVSNGLSTPAPAPKMSDEELQANLAKIEPATQVINAKIKAAERQLAQSTRTLKDKSEELRKATEADDRDGLRSDKQIRLSREVEDLQDENKRINGQLNSLQKDLKKLNLLKIFIETGKDSNDLQLGPATGDRTETAKKQLASLVKTHETLPEGITPSDGTEELMSGSTLRIDSNRVQESMNKLGSLNQNKRAEYNKLKVENKTLHNEIRQLKSKNPLSADDKNKLNDLKKKKEAIQAQMALMRTAGMNYLKILDEIQSLNNRIISIEADPMTSSSAPADNGDSLDSLKQKLHELLDEADRLVSADQQTGDTSGSPVGNGGATKVRRETTFGTFVAAPTAAPAGPPTATLPPEAQVSPQKTSANTKNNLTTIQKSVKETLAFAKEVNSQLQAKQDRLVSERKELERLIADETVARDTKGIYELQLEKNTKEFDSVNHEIKYNFSSRIRTLEGYEKSLSADSTEEELNEARKYCKSQQPTMEKTQQRHFGPNKTPPPTTPLPQNAPLNDSDEDF